MPYFITVLALVFIGVGFTLFHQNEQSLGLTEETPSIETVSETGTTVSTEPPKASEVVTVVEPTEEVPLIKPASVDPEVPDATQSNPVPKTPIISPTYANGTYNAQTSYRTPDGTYQMTVGVTVQQDEVTATTLTFDSQGARDAYSKRFANSYKSSLIGKDLESISLSRVGGASLTTKAFNTALGSIRAQAS